MEGEYLPRVRKVSMSKKLTVLDFTRDSSGQLVSALEVKDYTLAEQLVAKMRKAKPRTSTTASRRPGH